MTNQNMQIKQASNLAGHFLIAMPQLDDPNFTHTLTYLCEHSDQGALGIVVNRPLQVSMADLFEHAELPEPYISDVYLHQSNVFAGGPVQKDRGFVLHDGTTLWESSIRITDKVNLTTSKDILSAIAQGAGPEKYLVALGYAGWGAGQLEQEVAGNAWLTVPADPKILFSTPVEQRWAAASMPLGIDLNLISSSIGHA